MSVFPVAMYPNSIWDTLTQERDDRHDFIEPGPKEYLQILAEIEALEIDLIPTAEEEVIWVSPNGRPTGTGSIINPFSTLAAAFAAITSTKKTVMVRPGNYSGARIYLPVNQDDIKVIGLGGSSVCSITAPNTGHTVQLSPGTQGATFTFTFEGFTINPPGSRDGLNINLVNQDAVVVTKLKDIKIDGNGTDLAVLHEANYGHQIFIEDCDFGTIDINIKSASDQITLRRTRCHESFATSADNIAMDINFDSCIFTDSGIYGGHSAQTIKAVYCKVDGELMEAADFTDGGADHTIAYLAPVS